MKVKVEGEVEEITAESDQLPVDEVVEQPIIEKDEQAEKIRVLELEKARLEGEVRGRTASATPAVDPNLSVKQLHAQVWADANALDDEEFKSKYKTEKHRATAALLQDDLQKTKTANSQEIAELRAEQRMGAKYGKDFYDVKTEVDEMLSFASAEVRQDPEKLSKFMEKAYQAARKDKPVEAAGKKVESVNRSKITGGFSTPMPTGMAAKGKEEDNDLVVPEYRQIARAFGITSEKERKKLMENDIVPIDFGAGIVFRDPEKGFERISAA